MASSLPKSSVEEEMGEVLRSIGHEAVIQSFSNLNRLIDAFARLLMTSIHDVQYYAKARGRFRNAKCSLDRVLSSRELAPTRVSSKTMGGGLNVKTVSRGNIAAHMSPFGKLSLRKRVTALTSALGVPVSVRGIDREQPKKATKPTSSPNQTGILQDLETSILRWVDDSVDDSVGWWKEKKAELKHAVRTREVQLPGFSFSPFRFTKRVVGSVGRILSSPLRWLNNAVNFNGIDLSTSEEIVLASGLPFELLQVCTADGYLLRIERLPRRKSRKVLLLLHGILDSSYCWIANCDSHSRSLAYLAHEKGFDIFLLNMRGNMASREHLQMDAKNDSFWSFSMNEHAFFDIPACVNGVRRIKEAELSGEDCEITVVAHSMGCACLLMYLIWKRDQNLSHHLDHVVLLSPAGVHLELPLVARIGLPLLNATLGKVLPCFWIPPEWEIGKRLLAKLAQDLRSLPACRDFVSLCVSWLLGGAIDTSAFALVHRLVYNVFSSACSTKLLVHFAQQYKSKRFQAFDYGPEKNEVVYGSAVPFEFLSRYSLIDIPVHVAMGVADRLISPRNVMLHVEALRRQCSEQFKGLRVFSDCSHLDFTGTGNLAPF